jgi:hypothetical protein
MRGSLGFIGALGPADPSIDRPSDALANYPPDGLSTECAANGAEIGERFAGDATREDFVDVTLLHREAS